MSRARDVADTQDNVGGAVAPFVAGKNAVINGGFDIWQRGTSFTSISNAAYAGDRWCIFTNSITGRDVSRQATGDTTNLPFIQYCSRVGRASGNTNTSAVYIGQSFETINSIPLAGKTVTMSFYARAGANFSSASNVLGMYAAYGTGTDQNIFVGYTGQAQAIAGNATLTTTWQRFTYTGAVPSNATEFGFYLGYAPTGTAGANDYFEITGVQVEIGSQATPFSRAGGSIGGELALCQRYYWRAPANGVYTAFASGSAYSTGSVQAYLNYPVPMRVVPTSVDFSTVAAQDIGTGGFTAITGVSINVPSVIGTQLLFTGGSGFTQYRPYVLASNNSTSAYLGLSAEL